MPSIGTYNVQNYAGDNGTSISYDSGTYRNSLFLCDIHCSTDSIGDNDPNVNTITYDGNAMTSMGSLYVGDQGGHWYRHRLFRYFMPVGLGSKTFAVTFNKSVHYKYSHYIFYNIDPVTIHRTVATQSFTHANDQVSTSVSPTSAVDDLVFNCCRKWWNNSVNIAVGSGQTSLFTGTMWCSSTKPGEATSTTMTFSVQAGYGGEWTHFGVALVPNKKVSGVMIFAEQWRKRLYNKLIQQGAVPLGRRDLLPI